MKPIVDYGPAFENNIYTSTNDYVSDSPTTYPNGTPLKNWDNTYFGSMTVKSALALSRNIPAVKTLINVGLDNSSKFVDGLGINLNPLQYSNAISSNTNTKNGGRSEERRVGKECRL